MPPSFSVIIPVYNVQDYLTQCVESVLGQQGAELEIWLVDDGSTDASGALCDTLALRDARIRVVHQRNLGLAGARNTGMARATGDWLLFLDSDDFWQDGFISRLVQAIGQHPEDAALIGRFLCLYPDGRRAFDPTLEPFVAGPVDRTLSLRRRFEHYAAMASHAVWKICIRRDWVEKHKLYFAQSIRFSEDIPWTLELFQTNPPARYVDLVFCEYRISREGSIMYEFTDRHLRGLIAIYDYIRNSDHCAQGPDDAAFATSFAANKVLGGYQHYVQYYAGRPERQRQIVPLMEARRDIVRSIRRQDVSLRRWLTRRLFLLLGARGAVRAFDAYARVKRLRSRVRGEGGGKA